jgi:hypothetical protein
MLSHHEAIADETACACPVVHPFGQLQLELLGIQPTTAEEQAAAWIAQQEDPDLPAVLQVRLLLTDSLSRKERAQRWAWVRSVQAPYDNHSGWLIPGGTEAVWLYDEATRSYTAGLYVAGLLCAHACCERVLAGCLQWHESRLDKNWRRWGLGPLVAAAFDLQLVDVPLRDALLELTELRKMTAHFKPPLMPGSVSRRAFEAEPDADEEDVLDQVLRADAEMALVTATRLLRSPDQGFGALGAAGAPSVLP